MRVRSMLAGLGLATVTMLWGVPVASASEIPVAPAAAVQGTLAADPGEDEDGAADGDKSEAPEEADDQIKTFQPTRDRAGDPQPFERNTSNDGDRDGDRNRDGDRDGDQRNGLPGTGGLNLGNNLCLNLPVVEKLLCEKQARDDRGGRDGRDGRDGDRYRDRDRDRDRHVGCDRDHRFDGERDRWRKDCHKDRRDRACGCDSDDDDRHSKKDDDDDRKNKDDDDDKDSKNEDDDEDSEGGTQTVEYPKGAPETGGGPVGADNPLPMLALGLTGLAGAGLAGAGAIAERRAARR